MHKWLRYNHGMEIDFPNGSKLRLVIGDITKIRVDAIVNAANSSLAQIMKAIAAETGATVQGMAQDQRIFGIYGPGRARDVISQLLDGSGYNVLMVGDLGQGTPRQILLWDRLFVRSQGVLQDRAGQHST